MCKIYTSNFRCNLTVLMLIVLFFNEIFIYKRYIASSVYNDIISKYKQDYLGLIWSIILPIVPMTLYMMLSSIKAFKESENMPYMFYITTGMTIWLLMSETIVITMKSIKKNKSILLKSNFPFSVVYISSIGELLVNTMIRLVFVIFILTYYSISIDVLNIFLTIFFMIPVIVFAFAFGILLSIFDIYIPDTKRVIDMFLRYGLFLSSVIFPFPTDGTLGYINQLNIFNNFVNSVREILYFGELVTYTSYIVFSSLSFFIFVMAIIVSLKLEFKVRSTL